MLLEKVDLLESQTRHYRKLVSNYAKQDTLHQEMLQTNKDYYDSVIYSLNNQLKSETRKKRAYKIGLFGAIGGAVLGFFIIK